MKLSRALVLGGTGFVGAALARELSRRGLSVDALGSGALDLAAAGAHDKLAARLDAATVLVAAFRAPSRLPPEERCSADLAMTANVANAAAVRPAATWLPPRLAEVISDTAPTPSASVDTPTSGVSKPQTMKRTPTKSTCASTGQWEKGLRADG